MSTQITDDVLRDILLDSGELALWESPLPETKHITASDLVDEVRRLREENRRLTTRAESDDQGEERDGLTCECGHGAHQHFARHCRLPDCPCREFKSAELAKMRQQLADARIDIGTEVGDRWAMALRKALTTFQVRIADAMDYIDNHDDEPDVDCYIGEKKAYEAAIVVIEALLSRHLSFRDGDDSLNLATLCEQRDAEIAALKSELASLESELGALQHDIERYVTIAGDLATENAALRLKLGKVPHLGYETSNGFRYSVFREGSITHRENLSDHDSERCAELGGACAFAALKEPNRG